MAATLPHTSLLIDTKALQKAAATYRAINHTLRLQIVGIINAAGSINLTPIIKQLKLEKSVISAHLKILRDAKFVFSQKKGNSVYYSVNYQEVNRISVFAEKLIPYKTHTSDRLQNVGRTLILKKKEETIRFTATELKIIRLVCEQNSNEEIAQALGISKKTVEGHRSSIVKKMKVRNSVGILFFAVKNGLFKV